MAIGDIYRVKLTQGYGTSGIESQNIFHYRQVFEVVPTGDAAELLEDFKTNVDPLIRSIQTTDISTLQIAVENVIPGIDNAYESFALGARVGSVDDQPLPPHDAWAFRINRVSSAVRNGQKRFWGVPESAQDNGVATAVLFAERVALATRLTQDLGGVGTFNTYRPIIYRRAREEVTIPAKTIPAMIAAAFEVSTAAYVAITTQNSRKYGSGS